MARIHIDIPDEEHRRFRQQAEQDGLTLGEWMTKAAKIHLKSRGIHGEQKYGKPFKSEEEIREFFRLCDELTAQEGPEREPDWEEHKKVILEGMMSGWTGT